MFLYANTDAIGRHQVWAQVTDISSLHVFFFLLVENFNYILTVNDKKVDKPFGLIWILKSSFLSSSNCTHSSLGYFGLFSF